MWSLHVKATMMKISHPIVFGHAVSVYYKDVFDKYGDLFRAGRQPEQRHQQRLRQDQVPAASQQEEILHDIHEVYSHRRKWRWSTRSRGITNLHIPSDVIVDASMPAMIRNSGQMWRRDGKQRTPRRHAGGTTPASTRK